MIHAASDSVRVRRRRSLAACGALAAVALWTGRRYLTGELPIGVDHTLVLAPWFSLQSRFGFLPLFDPYTLAGVPLYDNLQAALLYPLRFPFSWFADWRDYYAIYVFLHLPIALTGAYALARVLRLRRTAALAAAILFGCGGYLAGRPINPVILFASAWFPWLLFGAAGDRPRHLWATSLALAMILTIGSPHLYIYSGLGYAIVAALAGFRWTGPGARTMRQWLTLRFAHLLLPLVYAAPTLYPGLMRVARSVRPTGSIEQNLADSVAIGQLPRVLLGGTGGVVHPEFIDMSCYVGAVACLLAVATLFNRRLWRDRRWWAAVALTAAGLLIALGRNVGLQHIISFVPGLRWLTAPDRALVLPALGMALLAGFGLDRLTPRRATRHGWAALALAAVALALFLWEVHAIRQVQPRAPGAGRWLSVWLAAPPAALADLFPWLDALVGTLFALLLFAVLKGRPRLLRPALAALILLQCLHFAPRVAPPMRDRSFYDPPPPVNFLRAQAARSPEPFRVFGYDPLRVHDNEVNSAVLLDFLVPQLATLYGLEDVQGFDPLIPARYAALIEQTAGRAPHNDPLRNLDLAWPDPRAVRLLGVRYVLGDPYGRRVTHLPMSVNAQSPWARLPADADLPTSPATGWSIVSLIDGDPRLPLGAEIARLHVDAAEGRFTYPIRNGVESAHIRAAGIPGMREHPQFRAVLNTFWTTPQPVAEVGYAVRDANWRGRIDFGRALTVRGAQWELTDPSAVFFIAAQACRLQSPPPEFAAWRLAFGRPDDVAPVYEYVRAAPRAVLLPRSAVEGHEAATLENALALDTVEPIGSVRWVESRPPYAKLELDAPEPAMLLLRQPYDDGMRRNGIRIAPLAGWFIGHTVPAGPSRVELDFSPPLGRPLALTSLICFLALAALLVAYRLFLRRRGRI
jgi:hypothetical protein